MASSDDPTNVPQLPSNDTLTWSWKGSDEWITRATISQNQLYATNAGRMYEASQNYDHIETKILISAFGNPTSTNRSMSTRLNHFYTRPQRKIAIKIRKKMQKHARTESVKLNAVYVMAFLKEKQETMVPVFYFETSGNSCKYIDLQARIYNNWKHFLETNVIDPALCCYPINGHYAQTQTTNTPSFDENVQVQLKVYESPSCSILKTAGRWAQTALTYGTYILMAASMVATVSGAQCIARFSKLNSFCNKMKLIKPYINQAQKFTQYANAATAIASSILNIHDKMTHDQEEILADVTLIVSSVLSILSDPINRAIIKGGLGGKDLANAKFSDLSSISRIFLQLFCFARCATSIISVVTIISTMLLKDQCTGVDYFNLASSLFTCYGTVTSPLTAKKIFEQVQNEYKMEEFNAIKKQIEAEKAKNIKGPGIAEAAAATGAAIVVAATGNKPSQNDANSSDSKPSENQPNESGQCTNDKTSCNNTDSQKTAAESGGGDDPNNPIIPKREHQVEGTETYKNNPKTNKAGLRGEPPITEAEKEALIKRRDELAKKIVTDENDEAGKAAKEYYEKNIILAFRGTENEHVMNQQLVRMMEAADDIKDLFCEIALTETTFDIRRGVLLVNGQLNIDGAAFARATNNLNGAKSNVSQRLLDKLAAESAGKKYEGSENDVKSDRERIMAKTKHYNDNKQAIVAKLEEDKAKLTKERIDEREKLVKEREKDREGYLKSVEKKREQMIKDGLSQKEVNQKEAEFAETLKTIDRNTAGMLEKFDKESENKMIALNVDPFLEFSQEYRIVFEPKINQFEQKLANLNLTDFEINGKKVFKNLSTPEYFRLIQQFDKDNISKDNGDSMKAAMIMAEKVGLNNVEGIAACHQQVLNEMYANIGDSEDLKNLRQDFLTRFNDPNNELSTNLAKNFSEALDETEKCLIEKRKEGGKTEYEHRYDLNNEDNRTVAAMAYVHATEGGKKSFRRGWSQQQRIDATRSDIFLKSERTGLLRLSQDGLKWVMKETKEEEEKKKK